MAPPFSLSGGTILLIICIILSAAPPVTAFGAGNIPSIAQIEGYNWRHGDIEDMLKTVAFLKGHKWTTLMIKRVYFGNWLRDYSQAVDVGSLKGASAPTIRILVWVLSFLSFGYATAEFEVTEERLGVYRPEEHIDNPKDYADNLDARKFDPRLRGPILPAELEIDPNTGMKNYIANERGGWATSSGYIKHCFSRSIHFGRVYTNGASGRGKEEDLCEALRCLGAGLHCMEDFGAHTNYCELALRELGFHDVFPHVGLATEMNLRGRRAYPLVTGTFGAVDFLHSVLGEANDHFTQTEVDELDSALKNAESATGSQRGTQSFVGLVSQIPGLGGGLADQAKALQAESQAQEQENEKLRAGVNQSHQTGLQIPRIAGISSDIDPVKVAAQIYPILEFRDKIVRAINNTIAKVPGLESLVTKISETLTLFILSLLAPFVRPIIEKISEALKTGSSTVVNASASQQYIVWDNPRSSDPTHSMLSKDHFSNELNSCAGRVATTILQYVAPRVIYAWENINVPVDEVMNDILRVFHHPAIRDESVEIQRNMFNTVRKWVDEYPNRANINNILNSSSVKAGKNHRTNLVDTGHSHAVLRGLGENSNSKALKVQNRDLGEGQGFEESSPLGSNIPPRRTGSPSSSRRTPDFIYHNAPLVPPQQQASSEPFLRPDGSYSKIHGSSSFQQVPPANYPPYSRQGPGQELYGQGQPGENWQTAPGGPSMTVQSYEAYPVPGYPAQASPPPHSKPPYGVSPEQYPGDAYGYGWR